MPITSLPFSRRPITSTYNLQLTLKYSLLTPLFLWIFYSGFSGGQHNLLPGGCSGWISKWYVLDPLPHYWPILFTLSWTFKISCFLQVSSCDAVWLPPSGMDYSLWGGSLQYRSPTCMYCWGTFALLFWAICISYAREPVLLAPGTQQ